MNGDEVEQAAVDLLGADGLVRDALFLRQYGERPPGAPLQLHAETWADWDRRAEAYLRGLDCTWSYCKDSCPVCLHHASICPARHQS